MGSHFLGGFKHESRHLKHGKRKNKRPKWLVNLNQPRFLKSETKEPGVEEDLALCLVSGWHCIYLRQLSLKWMLLHVHYKKKCQLSGLAVQ